MPRNSTRSEKLDLRLTPSDKEKIYSAAAAEKRTVSDYALGAILSKADETLADRKHFGLKAEQWEAFLNALEAPTRTHDRMERLLNEPSIFERNS